MRHQPGVRTQGFRPLPPETGPDPEVRYSARHFLEDEQRLLAATHPTASSPLHYVDLPDGRLLPLPTDPLRRAMMARHDAAACFSTKYGQELGEEHERRFRAVLDYVESHCGELMEAGLACEGEPIAVREEFLDYLLNCRVEPTPHRIPGSVLGRFLDEWGHRWL